MNKLIHGGVVMEPDLKSTKEVSHHHIITQSLLEMDFCDEKFKKHHKQSTDTRIFVIISILFVGK